MFDLNADWTAIAKTLRPTDVMARRLKRTRVARARVLERLRTCGARHTRPAGQRQGRDNFGRPPGQSSRPTTFRNRWHHPSISHAAKFSLMPIFPALASPAHGPRPSALLPGQCVTVNSALRRSQILPHSRASVKFPASANGRTIRRFNASSGRA